MDLGFDQKIFQDDTAWLRYDCGDEGDICVYRRCHCGKYLATGKVFTNNVKGWICKTHGEVEPFWVRD
jgi:hypothetical protein